MNQNSSTAAGNPTLQLTLATGAFAVCFAIFGSVSAMMPLLRDRLALSPMQVSIALAVPVLLGSLGRIPAGMLTDRFGGRSVYAVMMAISILPAIFIAGASTYAQLLAFGAVLGISLASFSVGAAFSSRWYPPAKQGTALGIYGAGNAGQSLAAFGAPVVAATLGFAWGFRIFALIAFLWLLFWLVAARNPVVTVRPQSFAATLAPMREGRCWILSLYYFLTFGGFVAMSVYLPTFLTDLFSLTPQDAGLRTAGFVLLATAMRPVGGILSDRVGGETILTWVFPATAVFAIFMSFPTMVTFTIGALGMAAAIGLGNGAVFKLVPQSFPKNVGSATGLVGAAGGLGGFFPPLLLGTVRTYTGSFLVGFMLLAAFSILCLIVLRRDVRAAAAVSS